MGLQKKSKENTEVNLVVENIKRFLNSDKKEMMEYCYFSIINKQKERYFRDTITVMDDNKFDSLFPLVSLVILTANKIESDSLNYIAFKHCNGDLIKRRHAIQIFKGSDLGAPDAYLFKLHSAYILHLNAYETGANTPGGSTDLVRYISRNIFINPICIISFGICYGRDPSSQDIGDVLIPKKLYTWSVGQKIGDKGLKIKHDNFNFWMEDKFSESGIYSILNNFCNGNEGKIIKNSIKFKKTSEKSKNTCNFSVNVSWGNMSTGEAVVSSHRAKKIIRDASGNDEEFGGEMEGYGVAKECIFYAKVPCFIIKAICDWGVCKDIDNKLEQEDVECPDNLKDKLQAYAAFCAAIVLLQLLNDEKEIFFSLEIIKWMDNQRGKSRVNRYIYAQKDKIIANIKNYYKIDSKKAKEVFDIMIENRIFKATNDGYRTNIDEN